MILDQYDNIKIVTHPEWATHEILLNGVHSGLLPVLRPYSIVLIDDIILKKVTIH